MIQCLLERRTRFTAAVQQAACKKEKLNSKHIKVKVRIFIENCLSKLPHVGV